MKGGKSNNDKIFKYGKFMNKKSKTKITKRDKVKQNDSFKCQIHRNNQQK